MRQLRQQLIERLKRSKKRQWFPLFTVILSGIVIWGIHKTKVSAGWWGILDDEIAVVTIETDEDDNSSVTIKDPSKSVWDGLELLGVPLILAVLGAWFQKSQQEQSEKITREQREQNGDETREEVLQLYFDRVSTLLIDKNLMAIATKKEKVAAARDKGELEVSIDTKQEELLEIAIDVIRARTLSILRRFNQDSERKGSVIRFLIETDGIARLRISLSDANLSNADLGNADLGNADLSNADLSNADLSNADLSNANLRFADLRSANLSRANLSNANLSNANLSRANLSNANLSNANLRFALLGYANLCNANLSNARLSFAKMRNVDLSKADLSNATLAFVSLFNANLSDANLRSANLRSANLRDANLSNVDLSESYISTTRLGNAIVTNAKFGEGFDIFNEMTQNLIQRGAIFDTEEKEQPLIPNESE